MSNCRSYICTDCNVVFQVFGQFEQRRFYCVKCGDFVSVRRYHSLKRKTPRRWWNDEEKADLERVLKGEMQPYQLAVKHNRTPKAVRTALADRRKEMRTNENGRGTN